MQAISRAYELSSTPLQCNFALSLALSLLTFLVLISHLRRIFHTAGRIVAPSGTLSLFYDQNISVFLIDGHIIFAFPFLILPYPLSSWIDSYTLFMGTRLL